ESSEQRLLTLLRLGSTIPPPPLLSLGEHTRVRGCASVVHVTASQTNGRLTLGGGADSRLARGLVALLVRGLEGEPSGSLGSLSPRAIAQATGLRGVLAPSRINGIEGMLRVMRAQLEEQAEREEEREREREKGEREEGQREEGEGEREGGGQKKDQREAERAGEQVGVGVGGVWGSAGEEVALLLSGGVDSSVALHSLLEAGQRVRAFYLRIWLEDEQAEAARGSCPWEEDWRWCEAVCGGARVPLESLSLQKEYSERVVSYLLAEARAGRTPNPDVMCNSRIKFGAFHASVGSHFAGIASGHYARTHTSHEGRPTRLLTSADAVKDQTYFLSQLSQSQLASAIFPIGGMSKAQVREKADALGLPNRARKDSQGICFLGKIDYDDFLHSHLGESRGDVIEEESGLLVGEHRGLWFHTVGQRRGVGPVLSNAYRAKGPWHVVRKQMDSNTLYVSRSYNAADKTRNHFEAHAINWVAGEPPWTCPLAMPLMVKVRHGPQFHQALVTLKQEGTVAEVQLEQRDKGLAPGQFAAFYDGEICLGSGVITN
ncbi:MAG: hypothetical protein SGPRY_012384, partial [Prymnesium sp.]